MKTIHLRLGRDPLTLCKKDVQAREVLWSGIEGYRELMDGELQGIQGCADCQAEATRMQLDFAGKPED